VVIIGDVHGCFDELVELLEICRGRDPHTCTIFVGDLINKGPKSGEVVKLAREMGAYCVRGNHDEVCLRSWQNYVEGRQPLSKAFQWLQQLSREDLQWLHELPYTLTIPSMKIHVVHAGLVPLIPLNHQPLDSMLHIRDVSYNALSSKWVWHKKAAEGSIPWASAWEGPEHVYFGHDAIRRLQQYPLATGLDTGCVYGGKLTAVFPLEGNRVVQVDAHTVHKEPGKKHRDTP
jgi:diadenosine tetraphosphatase ApaH/serine/threonine PP2A family protein phosphatase